MPRLVLQAALVTALIVGAVYTLTTPADMLQLPSAQWRLVEGTRGSWGPLACVAAVLAWSLWLEWRGQRFGTAGWIVVGVLSVTAIGWFFRGGQIDWQNSRDWQKEWTYYEAVKETLATGRLPWHINAAFHYTNKFFANPETVIAPHLVALTVLSIPAFVFAQSLLVVAVGVLAFRALALDLEFGPVATVAFLAVFLFNGYILGHLGGGHLQWISCFLYPAVFLFVHRYAAGDRSRRAQAGLACALAGLLTIGGWHMFVWAILFTASFFAVDPRRWRDGAFVALLTIGLGAYRILPAAIAHEGFRLDFLASYRDITTFVAAFVGDPRPFDGRVLWIEYDAYVGWIGLLLLGIGLTTPLSATWRTPVGSLWLPSLIVLVLTWGNAYRFTLFQLPAFASQRVASRFIIISLLGCALLGCAQLNRWLRARRFLAVKLFAVGCAGVFLAAQLLVRADERRPAPDTGAQIPVVHVITDTPPALSDRLGLLAGCAVTVLTSAAVLRLRRREEFGPPSTAAA